MIARLLHRVRLEYAHSLCNVVKMWRLQEMSFFCMDGRLLTPRGMDLACNRVIPGLTAQTMPGVRAKSTRACVKGKKS